MVQIFTLIVKIIMNNHFSGQSSNRFSLKLIFSMEIALRKHIDILRLLILACLIASAMSDSAKVWTSACQVPLSMGFSRQEYWSRQPFPSPGDLPDPGVKPGSPTLEADSLRSEPPGKP